MGILSADVILADKLVPSGVLDLIPRRTPVHIARKFPGNAELAQQELLSLGLAGLQAGKTVLRLKQGDPYIYGRGGEEFEYFRKEGYGDRISVLPGITSALSAPLFAQIPATQRGVSDQVLICTGTGRKGKPSVPPEYVDTRTVVFLMALHRISGLVADLTSHDSADAMVLGKACEALIKGDKGRKWVVEEGFKGFDDFVGMAGIEELVGVSEKTEGVGSVMPLVRGDSYGRELKV